MKTCAIVGNSSCLLDKSYGSFIDSHDEVIRFNMARTRGFKKYVGTKTTIRFCNQHIVMSNFSDDYLKEQLKVFPEWDNKEILTWEKQKLFFKYSKELKGTELESQLFSKNNEIYYISDLEIIKLKRKLNVEPTMGLVGLDYALTFFSTINCFGFDFYKNQNRSFHYFEKTIPYKSCHDHKEEKKFFKDAEESGKIKIYR
jgi:hypothetical protein